MLNIELIRFEAQDVITASGVANTKHDKEVCAGVGHFSYEGKYYYQINGKNTECLCKCHKE